MSAFPFVRLRELTLDVQTWNPLRSDEDDEFDYIDLSAVSQELKAISEARKLKCAEAPSRARQLVKANDVLVSTVRPNLNGVALVTNEFDGATASTGFCVIRPNPERLSANYLFHWVKNDSFVKSMVMQATGASYPAVSDKIVLDSAIPLPGISEQRRIAAILDKADALRAKRREALAQLERLAQSIFVEMFGDPAKNPMNWPWQTLGSIAEKFSDGPFGSNLKSEHYVDDGIRVIRLQNIGVGEFVDADKAFISQSHYQTIRKHECVPGDVLVGTLGDPNLRACILPDTISLAVNKADCVQIRVNPRKANAFFVSALLNHPSTERLAQDLMHGQTRVRISMGSLRGLEVPMPDIHAQTEFARRIKFLDSIRKSHEMAAAEQRYLFESLQRRAFQGVL